MAASMGVLYGLGAALCFALTPIFYERGAKDLPSPFASLVRLGLPTAVLAIMVARAPYAREVLATSPLHVALVLVGGVVNLAVADTLLIRAIGAIGVSRAVSISSVYPLFVMLILGEPLALRTVTGVGLVVAGIYLVSTSRAEAGTRYRPTDKRPRYGFGLGRALRPAYLLSLLRSSSDTLTHMATDRSDHTKGILLSLGAAVCWAVGIAIFKTVVDTVRPEVLNLYRMAGALIFMLLMNALMRDLGTNIGRLGGRHIALLSAGGLIGSVGGSLFMYRGLALADGGVISSIAAASPIITALVSVLLGEAANRKLLGGAAATVAGIALVVG